MCMIVLRGNPDTTLLLFFKPINVHNKKKNTNAHMYVLIHGIWQPLTLRHIIFFLFTSVQMPINEQGTSWQVPLKFQLKFGNHHWSWLITKNYHVKWNIFHDLWWSNMMTFHDIWRFLVTFDDYCWFFINHDESWLIMKNTIQLEEVVMFF